MVRGDEQFLESGGPGYPEPAISFGSPRPVSDALLPSQTTSAGAARPRRRRLKAKKKEKKKRLLEEDGDAFSSGAKPSYTRLIPRASLFVSSVRGRSRIRRHPFLSESSSGTGTETEILCSDRRYDEHRHEER